MLNSQRILSEVDLRIQSLGTAPQKQTAATAEEARAFVLATFKATGLTKWLRLKERVDILTLYATGATKAGDISFMLCLESDGSVYVDWTDETGLSPGDMLRDIGDDLFQGAIGHKLTETPEEMAEQLTRLNKLPGKLEKIKVASEDVSEFIKAYTKAMSKLNAVSKKFPKVRPAQKKPIRRPPAWFGRRS